MSAPLDPNVEKKLDKDMEEHLKKACTNDEAAPKSKHIRSAIVATWDQQGSRILWIVMRRMPLSKGHLMCWKALITLWKVLQDGHPNCLPELNQTRSSLAQLGQTWQNATSSHGYGPLIVGIVEFLQTKLQFHHDYPSLPGNLNMDNWHAFSSTLQSQTAFLLCVRCFELQEAAMRLAGRVFGTLSPNEQLQRNECRAAAFVPLLTESVALYEMTLDLMKRIHDLMPPQQLSGHRVRFGVVFDTVKQNFFDARQLKYLNNLFAVPLLPDDPPMWLRAPEIPPRPAPASIPEPEPVPSFDAKFDAFGDVPDSFSFQSGPDDRDKQIAALKAEIARLRARVSELEQQKKKDADLIRALQEQLFEMQQEVSGAEEQQEEQKEMQAKLERIAVLAKTNDDKYQKAFGMYSKLRNDHLALLKRKGELEAAQRASAATAEQAKTDHAEVMAQVAAMRQEQDRLRAENASLAAAKGDVAEQLQKQLEQARLERDELEKSKQQEASRFKKQLAAAELERRRNVRDLAKGILMRCRSLLQQALDDLDDPSNLGNTEASPHLTVDLCSASLAPVDDIAAALHHYDETKGADAKGLTISNALNFASQLAAALSASKGVTRLAVDSAVSEGILGGARKAATSALAMVDSFFDANQDLTGKNIDSTAGAFQDDVKSLSGVVESLIPRQLDAGDLQDAVQSEMERAMQLIEDAARRIAEMLAANEANKGTKLDVNKGILGAASTLMDRIRVLVARARAVQDEIVENGQGNASSSEFYKKNSRWTEGLLSAAKAVGFGASLLVQSADACVTQDDFKFEEIIVASKEISASTAQLVAASKVKSIPNSERQPQLMTASKDVTAATKDLVAAAQNASHRVANENKPLVDNKKLSAHQAKRMEMEMHVKVLELESQLERARVALLDLRTMHYQTEGDVGNE